MNKPTPTRTLNPLPFNELNPARFEDLVRQLAYEFKRWRRLEATGRSGSDDGFDARGYEIVEVSGAVAAPDEDQDPDESSIGVDRLWLIQCKRERSIGPAKLRAYLSEISTGAEERLYGLVFAAACDFSKKARDDLAAWCRASGVVEWHVWGRSEIEDMLVQPKFDHLLFAYFGISLTVRQRSQVTEIRRQVALKRRLKRVMDSSGYCLALIRDVDGDDYPFAYRDEGTRPRYAVRMLRALSALGLIVNVSMREAWLSADESEWDAALSSRGNGHIDEWNQPTQSEQKLTDSARAAWDALPDDEKAWLHFEGVIPYEDILLVDDIGDTEFEGPHLYVRGWDKGYERGALYIETIGRPQRRKQVDFDTPGRVEKYPAPTRELSLRKWGY